MLLSSNRLTVIGTAFLAAGIACSMFLVADFMFGLFPATMVAVATLLVIVSLWYVLPLSRRRCGGAGKTP